MGKPAKRPVLEYCDKQLFSFPEKQWILTVNGEVSYYDIYEFEIVYKLYEEALNRY